MNNGVYQIAIDHPRYGGRISISHRSSISKQTSIATRYGVAQQTVSDIKLGKSWQ